MIPHDQLRVKIPLASEMPSVYLMGYEVWNKGAAIEDYLRVCSENQILNSGTWWALSLQNHLVSSLALYNFAPHIYGFGSIATDKEFRGNGYARLLIQDRMDFLRGSDAEATIFLYSDIDPKYYAQFGFRALPEGLQRFPGSCCMVWGPLSGAYLNAQKAAPDYF